MVKILSVVFISIDNNEISFWNTRCYERKKQTLRANNFKLSKTVKDTYALLQTN